jgi:hypothetical protein
MLGESDEFRRLRHAVEKAVCDRERAIRNVCRLYTVNRFDALPGARFCEPAIRVGVTFSLSIICRWPRLMSYPSRVKRRADPHRGSRAPESRRA